MIANNGGASKIVTVTKFMRSGERLAKTSNRLLLVNHTFTLHGLIGDKGKLCADVQFSYNFTCLIVGIMGMNVYFGLGLTQKAPLRDLGNFRNYRYGKCFLCSKGCASSISVLQSLNVMFCCLLVIYA